MLNDGRRCFFFFFSFSVSPYSISFPLWGKNNKKTNKKNKKRETDGRAAKHTHTHTQMQLKQNLFSLIKNKQRLLDIERSQK